MAVATRWWAVAGEVKTRSSWGFYEGREPRQGGGAASSLQMLVWVFVSLL